MNESNGHSRLWGWSFFIERNRHGTINDIMAVRKCGVVYLSASRSAQRLARVHSAVKRNAICFVVACHRCEGANRIIFYLL